MRYSFVAAALLSAGSLAAQSPAQRYPVSIGGTAYAQYQYQFKDTANHVNNFDVTRAYINVIGRFDGGIGTRVTADIYRNSDGSLAYRLKYAFASYTPGKGPLTFKFGQIHTPLLDWEEAMWDYRMQGQMALERGGYVSSSDFGAGIDGNWSNGLVDMQTGVYNGENYNKAPGDQRKDFMSRVSFRLDHTDDMSRTGGLRLTGYAQAGKPTGGGQRERYLGMVSYRSTRVTLAGEYAHTRDSSTATPTARLDGRVVSVFGVLHVPQTQVALLGRVDITDPNTDVTGDKQTRIIGGVSYQLAPNVRLLGDVDAVSYQGVPTAAQYASKLQGLFQLQFTF